MQNKLFYQLLCVGFLAIAIQPALAQDADDFLAPVEPVETVDEAAVEQPQPDAVTPPVEEEIAVPEPTVTPAVEAPSPVIEPALDLTGKQAVDFPSQSSLDTLEFAPLPGIYEKNIDGPMPMAPSVSSKDMPSEQLLGRLTPEVFKELAELERDNTFLKLQIQKETMKNDLEKLRAGYRQARLDEISKREELIRTRIQWWQEQEKIRQDLEAQRAAAEAAKNAEEEKRIAEAAAAAKAAQEQLPEEVEMALQDVPQDDIAPAPAPEPEPPKPVYTLVEIRGVGGVLMAKVKNEANGKISSVRSGDTLPDGVSVTEITPLSVSLAGKGYDETLGFQD